MKPTWERTTRSFVTAVMESRYLTAQEADELLHDWENRCLRVCFAVCMGELAWHAHWVGNIRNASPGRWVLASGQTTNMVSTDRYKEILLTEDDEIVGLRFRRPDGGAPSFEVNLFIHKHDGLDQDPVPLISKIVQ